MPQTTHRRQWLMQTIGGLAAAGSAACPAAVSSMRRASKEPLRIAAIGLANRGFDNLLSISGERIVGLCDVDERQAVAARRRHPQASFEQDWRRLLDRNDVDAVMISTPDHTHAAIAAAALRRGLHVYCEKPLTHSVHEARTLAELAQRSPRLATQMGNQHHASDGYRTAVEWLKSGRLGAVREIHCWTNRPLWPQGIPRPADTPEVPAELHWDVWIGPAPMRPYHSAYHPMRWRAWWDFGNGSLGDMGPHLIDPVFWGLDLPQPKRIVPRSSASASEATSARSSDAGPARSSSSNGDRPADWLNECAPDWSVVRFELPREGDEILPLVWYDGGKIPPREATGVDRPPANGTMVVADRARMFIPELGKSPIVLARDSKSKLDAPAKSLERPASHVDEWLSACRGEGTASSEFGYASRLTQFCLLGAIATRLDRTLEWDDAQRRFVNDAEADRMLQREYRPGWTLDE